MAGTAARRARAALLPPGDQRGPRQSPRSRSRVSRVLAQEAAPAVGAEGRAAPSSSAVRAGRVGGQSSTSERTGRERVVPTVCEWTARERDRRPLPFSQRTRTVSRARLRAASHRQGWVSRKRSCSRPERWPMRYVGIDVGSRTHMVAIVDADCAIVLKPVAFGEDAAGYEKLFLLLGSAEDTLIAMEATGHYHRNLFAAVTARGFVVALLNPLRTHRFAEEDLQRGKTDRVDAVMLARFAAQKRPAPESRLDAGTVELRELVRLYERVTQDFGDRVRQLHRLVALCFPEFRQHVLGLDSQRATAILASYPTAAALRDSSVASVARLRYDGRHRVGPALARALVDAARTSVAQHHGPAYEAGVRALCEDIDRLRGRMHGWASDLEGRVAAHEVASLLTTIGGLGAIAAARIVAAV